MELPPLESIPLSLAKLCVNCSMITASTGERCAVCGSASLINLGAALKGRNGEK